MNRGGFPHAGGVNVYEKLTGLACGKLLLAMASGALIGAVAGVLLGGAMSAIAGGSFWEGFENGARVGNWELIFSPADKLDSCQ